MFDYMVRVLPNNRILIRNTNDKTSDVIKASQVSAYFENVLEAQLEAQEQEDAKIAEIKEQVNPKVEDDETES